MPAATAPPAARPGRGTGGARRAAVRLAAVGSVLGGAAVVSTAAAAPPGDSSPQTAGSPQGEVAGLFGEPLRDRRSAAAQPATTRAEIMRRAQSGHLGLPGHHKGKDIPPAQNAPNTPNTPSPLPPPPFR
ncbi:hypothetical protein ACIHEI_07990 [Kitasatospora sp. NPDC051984]|uniref:hypothetical protein n=1 Tax=Kitasatospora sp. NPDC051984 TaxID=3364059 RepID=UPI0037C6A0E8